MLDAVRYLVVWNPVLLLCMNFFMHFFVSRRFAKHKGDLQAFLLMSNGTYYSPDIASNHTLFLLSNANQTLL